MLMFRFRTQLCSNPLYESLMRVQCPRSCHFCDRTSDFDEDEESSNRDRGDNEEKSKIEVKGGNNKEDKGRQLIGDFNVDFQKRIVKTKGQIAKHLSSYVKIPITPSLCQSSVQKVAINVNSMCCISLDSKLLPDFLIE